jgi:putative transcriptional regulator
MLANSWLSVPATPEIVFELPYAKRWAAAAKTLGIDITQISPDAGHA